MFNVKFGLFDSLKTLQRSKNVSVYKHCIFFYVCIQAEYDAEQVSLLHQYLQQSWCSNPAPPRGRGAFGTDRGHCSTRWLSPAPWSCRGSRGSRVTVAPCCHACGEDAIQRLMGMNWYTCANSDFHTTVNKDTEFYLEV